MIGKLLGNLKIISKLGEGGMGVVYLAEHEILGNRFAVKSLAAKLTEDPGFKERFYNEARNQALLDHQNIVQVTDFHEQEGQYFLVMQFVSGQSLDDMIKEKGKLDEATALHILKDILSGLNFAHSKGVIHRDIKPGNVIIDESGRARITDFGIAIMVGDKRLTRANATVGSQWYMSPEQIVDPAHIDHRSDVYSAGIVLYEMLTGGVPFDGESDFTIQNKQVNDPVPDPRLKNPKITPELKKIILKALEKTPDKRYSGCGEFFHEIEHYEHEIADHTKPRSLMLLIALIVITLILGFAVWQLLVNQRTEIGNSKNTNNKSQSEETAYLWIETATEKAAVICRELSNEMAKKEYLNTPHLEEIADSSDIEKIKKQIADHELNIKEYTASYKEYIDKLNGIEDDIFNLQLTKYNDQLAQKESVARLKITKIVKEHYLELKKQSSFDVTVENSWKSCPQLQISPN